MVEAKFGPWRRSRMAKSYWGGSFRFGGRTSYTIARANADAVQGDRPSATAAFLAGLAVTLIGQESFEQSQEKGTKFALFFGGGVEGVAQQESRKEFLGQVLGVMPGVTSVQNVSKNGFPLCLAKT